MSSIREVARLAGVSPATVSRVMNGTAGVHPEKKEKVLRAIAETGFVPNEVARSLFRKSAKTIGLLLPGIENPFFTQLAEIIEKEADANGYRVLFCNTGDDFEKEKMALQMMKSMNADGIILTRSEEKLQSYVESMQIPVVITDASLLGGKATACVYGDHYQGGRLATEHLLECGCRKIVCMKGVQTLNSAKARYEGYRDVCMERGIEERTIDCDYSFQTGLKAAEQLLEKYPDTDGIIASNDMVAISVFKVLHKRQILVPEQIQLIGFDDIYLSSLLTPELTTITQPMEEIGKKAVEVIIDKDRGDDTGKQYVFPVSLTVRDTTRIEKKINT